MAALLCVVIDCVPNLGPKHPEQEYVAVSVCALVPVRWSGVLFAFTGCSSILPFFRFISMCLSSVVTVQI